jgi:hypothetical protein
MPAMTGRAAVACCFVLMSTGASAIQLTLDRRAIEEAVFIGQSRIDAERHRFHAPYRLSVARPPVDWIDVITPYHRVELAAEMNARTGSRQFGQREALEILRGAPNQIDLVVELSFHPLNTFVGVPLYQVGMIGPRGTPMQPRRVDRFPRFAPRVEPSWPAFPTPSGAAVFGGGQPVVGGTIIAAFDGSLLDPTARYEVVVSEAEREIARTVLDLGRMR